MLATRSLAAASGLLLVALVSGCAAAEGTAITEATAVASPDVADVQPNSTAEPVPAASAVLDCTNMLTANAYAELDEQGFEYRPAMPSYPPPAGAELVADGALECLWDVPAGDNRVWIARLTESEDLWNARVAALASAGWTTADGAMAGAFIRYPEFDEELQPAIAHVDGVTYFAEPGRVLRLIAATADRIPG